MDAPKGKDARIEDLRAWARGRPSLLAVLPYEEIRYRCGWCTEAAELPFRHRFSRFERSYCSQGCMDADVILTVWQQGDWAERKATTDRLIGSECAIVEEETATE